MYLYFNKKGELTTKIPHGEPLRQGNNLNLYVCFPLDFFTKNIKENYEVISTFRPPKKDVLLSYPLEYKGVMQFNKLKDSEMTFDLIDKMEYHFFFVSVSGITDLSGNILTNISIIEDDIQLYQENTNLFVEKTFGYKKNALITPDQYEILLEKLNDLDAKIEETDYDNLLESAKKYTDDKIADLNFENVINEAKAYTDDKIASLNFENVINEAKAYTDDKIASLNFENVINEAKAYTDELFEKTIEKVQLNGVELPINEKTVNVLVPVKISELIDDKQLATEEYVDNENLKMKEYVDNSIGLVLEEDY